MLEQQSTSQSSPLNDTTQMTQLEGIRQKVFIDRYSLKDAEGKALESYPEQLWERVAGGIAEAERTPEARAEWKKKFYEALTDFQFVPGGRILTGAGSGHSVTYYNCMPPDQEVLTADGYRPISEIKIGDRVVTHRNRLRPVLHKFERETEETLYTIRPKKIGYDDLRVTGEHKVYVVRSEWINKDRSSDGLRLQQEPAWMPAKDLKPGDYVAIAHNSEEYSEATISLQDYVPGYEIEDGKLFKATTRGDHGYVPERGTHHKIHSHLELDKELCYLLGRWLGDGCVTHRAGTDIPSGIKIVFSLNEQNEAVEIARLIEAKFGIDSSIKLSSTERWYDLWVNSMIVGEFFKAFLGCYSYDKQIPDQLMHLPAELTTELLRGLFSADGYISGNELGIVLANRTLTVQIHQLLLRLGYVFSLSEKTPRLGRVPAYRVQATANECAPLFESFFGVQAPEHNVDLKYYFTYDDLQWVRIDEIAVEDYAGVVLDIEVEEDHSFISAGVVVSNCFVIPSPEDSRHGILDNLKIMTEIMARGGGVGINLSTLRPRGSYIRTVNGTASGPCSWAQLYSVATGDVIQQGGCFGPDEQIATDQGLIPVKTLVDRLEQGEQIQALTHKGPRPFTYVFHNGRKDLYEVTTSRGNRVRVTLDHKMGVMRNGEIATIPLRELVQGDEILLLETQNASGNPEQSSQKRSDSTREDLSHELLTHAREYVATAHTLPAVSSDKIVSLELVGQSEVYDFEVEDVHMLAGNGIYTSNSRRGALMLMLDDNHPDVEEFITVKRTAGKIEHANLSVCISDKFMQAVKDDANWDLIWQEKVQKTIRARDLWDLICTSAWESAEPGMVFMDRCSAQANTWYYEDIRCVNPCVTGDTLIYSYNGLMTARELAELGTPITVVSPNILVEEHELALAGLTEKDAHDPRATRTTSDRGIYLRQASHVFETGIKPVYKLQTTEGYTLRLTADHKVLTTQGWKEASSLVKGENIHLLNGQGEFGMLDDLVDPATLKDMSQIPASLFQSTRRVQRNLLSDLFTADGTLERDFAGNGPSLRLTSASLSFLEDIQRLLLNFGIASQLMKPCGTVSANANRLDETISQHPAEHKLSISGTNGGVFAREIRLSDQKQAQLEQALTACADTLTLETFLATFESLTHQGEETVYDLSEPDRHLFVANGLVIHNCGEQPLPPWGVCNLGALNLSAFVENGTMNYEQLVEKTWVAMRFLDNVIDSTEYFIQENAEAQLGTRRTGLGTMGLADALIKMKIAYGSEESLPVIEKIYTTIRNAAYEASATYAAEKGTFPRFERDKYMQGYFIQQLPKKIQEKIRKNGIRNAVLLTQAPTGTTSLLSGVSSGIEPVYDFAMIRRDRTGEHILYHPLLQTWRDEHPNESTPTYFVSSKDLTPEEHVRVQATIQRYTDASISKTVNAPNEHTVEEVQKLYRMAYEMGCKGITYYRDGSRDAVLTRIADEKKVEKQPEQASVTIEPITSIQQGIKPRPPVVQGYTRQVNAPEGKINVTINSDDHGPLEIFVNVGKAGSDIAALAEALGRLISLNLRVLSPLSQIDRAKEIAEQLRGIGGSRSVGFGPQQVRSMPDAVARALEQHMENLPSITANGQQSSTAEAAHNGHMNGKETSENAQNGAQSFALTRLSVTGNLCPECGCNTMVYEEGCKKCYTCGYSEC